MLLKIDVEQPYNNRINQLQGLFIILSVLGFEFFSFINDYIGYSEKLSISYRLFYLIIGIAIIVINTCWYKEKIGLSTSLKIILSFWVLYLVRSIFDTLQNTDNTTITEFWIFSFLICFFSMFPLITKINHSTLKIAKKGLFFLALLTNIFAFKNNISEISETIVARFNANEVLNSITYGQSGLVLVILSLSFFLDSTKKTKLFYLCFILLGLANIGIAASRGPLLQLFCVLGFLIIYKFDEFKYSFFFIITLILVYWIFVLSEYLFIFNSVADRVINTNIDEERPAIFMDSWNLFAENPIFGHGTIEEYAHNIFLGSLESIGFLGGVLIFIIYINAFKESIKLVRVRDTDWVALLLVMQLVAALTSGAIWNSFQLWALLALVTNLYRNRNLYA
jgi:O-antigen ligase